MGSYDMWTLGERPVVGMMVLPEEARAHGAPPYWLPYVRVPDVRSAVKKAAALGGEVLHGPAEVPGGDLIAQCLDSQQAAFALHSTPRG